MKRAEVGDLQDALQLLLDRGVLLTDDEAARRELSEALRRERAEQTYGGATSKLVGRFQEEQRLQVIGEVDEPTANAMNALLKKMGVFDQEPAPRFYIVSGQVRREDGLPMRAVRVRAVHESDQRILRLGEDNADDEGRYTIRYELLPSLDVIDLRVSASAEDGRLLTTSDLVRRAKPVEIVDLIVPIAGRPSVQRRIEGYVVLEHGQPAEQMKLRLYRREFGGKATLLKETITLAGGKYAFTYDSEGKPASLEVRVVTAENKEILLTKPLNQIGDELRTGLNLVAPRSLKPLAAEYRRMATDLTSHVGQMKKLAEAKENVDRQDLTVLNRATGWDARLIALAAITERLATDTDVKLPQEPLYGLLRAGLPSGKLMLAQVEPDVAEQALKKVRDAGIVQITDEEIGQFKSNFAKFADRTKLAMPVPGSSSTYGDLLKACRLSDNPQVNDDLQKKFASVYLRHRGNSAQLWDEARKAGLNDVQIRKLQLQGKLAFLAGNSEAMTTRLLNRGMNDPVELVGQDFHRTEAWKNEVFEQAGIPQARRANLTDADRKKLEAMIPAAYAAEKVEARLEAYAEDMARKVRLSYPTQVLGRLMETDAKFKPLADPNSIALLKSSARNGFRLGQTPVDAYFKTRMTQEEFTAAQPQLQQVRTLQRMYQITPSNEAMPVLMSLGMTSAYDVVAYPENQFKALFEAKWLEIYQKLAPAGVAELISRKAKQVSSVTYNLFTIAKKLDSEVSVRSISGTPEQYAEAKGKLKDALKNYPTMESLFGSMDFCECEHCRSVLSPAAYLVDLLQFVDTEPEVWGNFLAQWKETHGNQDYPHKDKNGNPMKPYDVLIERRPDLPHIPLTCENTHTALPYIDIVNEILEYYVANGTLEKEAACDTGDATTAELLAEPQNVIRKAYDTLRAAQYPLNLPFDLWIETVRQFCNYCETPLHQVLEAFRPKDDLFAPAQTFDRAAIFTESLGLSPAEVSIFTDTNPLAKWHELYGFASPAEAMTKATDATTGQRIDLNSAKALSRRLGVTYKEMTEIVQTGFVNPKLTELVMLYKLGVTIQNARLYKVQKPFYEQNKDLIGKDRSTLSPADQQRFDALSNKVANSETTGWEIVNEVEAFEQRLKDLAAAFNTPLNDLQTYIQNIPFDNVLVLADPDTGCNFDLTTLQYADGAKEAQPIDFLRINLFVRLWRKLGWSIEETDRALHTFVPKNAPFETANLARQPLKSALIYLAHLKALDEKVKVGKESRLKLLTLWSNIATTGKKPLYAQLFLTRNILKTDTVFDDPLGDFLTKFTVDQDNVEPVDKLDPIIFGGHPNISVSYDQETKTQRLRYKGFLTDAEKAQIKAIVPGSQLLALLLDRVQVSSRISGHMLAVQGALGLTADEIGRILADAGKALDTAELSLANVSLLYRYGLLAKALKLTVRELITLKQLSGLDPFKPLHPDPLSALDQDHPFSQTLEFVKVAEEVKDSGLKIEDLDYLLRHRFEATGKYRPNREGMLALLKRLAEGVRAIRAEHAVPGDPAALSDEVLRQKLGLVLPADVVATFMAMMNGTVEFTAAKTGLDKANELKPATFSDEKRIRYLAYKEVPHKEQKLTFQGVLFDPKRAELQTKFDAVLTAPQSIAFNELLGGVQQKAKDFFGKHLLKQATGVQPASGFLNPGDYDLLFEPAPAGLTQSQLQMRERQRRTRLAQAFLPFLQKRLIRQFIVQTMTAQTGADPLLVESLLTDKRLLGGLKPLLDAFVAIGERGVSAAFYDSDDRLGAPQTTTPIVTNVDTALKDKNDPNGNPLNPARSGRFEGYLEVPTPGAYRFYIELEKQNAEAELRFPHRPEPVFLSGAAAADHVTLGDQPNEFLELKAGMLYRFSLDLKKLNGGEAMLLVQGETLPKGPMSQLMLYPVAAINAAERAATLLSKALQLVQSLGLSEREIRYLLTDGAGAFDNLEFNTLPWRDAQHALDSIAVGKMKADNTLSKEQAIAQARNENPELATEADLVTPHFKQFLRLAAYARLKRDWASGTDDLIGIFEANGTTGADKLEKQVYPLIAKVTRRGEPTVKATAAALFAAPALASEKPLQRLWEALQIVERFGVPPASLLGWTEIVNGATTANRRFEIARDVKESIKARFEPETWQRVAQPIFDKLRQRQRDALVSHVIHQEKLERMEQLYEYFLIDPGMEPVVQTSRIRLAIASMQLFIQRCLLNLEPKVHPSIINSKHWEWMKRYRVWEANRKIFLFPENWLEPEFRDDKTHLFSELEGAMLQGDVSSDLVEDAFLNYLKKLDELARLDIVAMHIEDNIDPARRVLHVFGRTYSQPHKYFYRRYAHQMWTPWEPVSAEIEGDHLAPVVWRDRLYLFWVTFMEKADPNPSIGGTMGMAELPYAQQIGDQQLFWAPIAMPIGATSGGKKLTEVTLSEVVKDLRAMVGNKLVDVQLHWSEYLQGEWSTRESGSFSPVISKTVSASFTSSSVFIHVSKEYDPADDEERGVYIHLGGAINSAFYLAGRNSAPESKAYGSKPSNPFNSANTVIANRYFGSDALKVSFQEQITTEPGKTPPKANPSILQQGGSYTLLPCNNDLLPLGVSEEAIQGAVNPEAIKAAIKSGLGEIASLMKPVFYQNNQHTFFVEPNVTEKTIEECQEWVTRTPQPEPGWRVPDWWKNIIVIPEFPRKWPIPLPDPGDPWRFPIDPSSLINPIPDRDWLINPGTAIKFDDVLIGPTGQPGIEIFTGVGPAVSQGHVNVNSGSDLASGSTVVLRDENTFGRSGLKAIGGGLNIVSDSGFNSALEKNFNDLNRSGFGAGMPGAGRMGR
jgi:hypothetical protein